MNGSSHSSSWRSQFKIDACRAAEHCGRGAAFGSARIASAYKLDFLSYDDDDDDDDDDVGVLRMTMIMIRLMLVIIRVMMLTMTMIMYSSFSSSLPSPLLRVAVLHRSP